ncbi:putative MarR family transcriptional regulator [Nocardia brasiliensis NBRC 14402]|uniref:MarR family winged helix-turn-helix transcriptional regulator n=1 Tax=Nocardia brasiliensis TaxID=37326 RepID=UPI0002E4EB59|nr:MarR family transcriptional regulator [Nocardia brasiliensis]GAJ84533.1 putative MarR family transcriptional regulator [Nocardia brasiliensis NBRC 14402]
MTTRIKDSLRAVRSQLALFNRQVSARLELKEVDFDCLDLINGHGPLSPSALAKHAGVHPATLTGVLDRLERAGWIVRERASDDRRAVVVRSLPDRLGEMYDLLSGMNTAVDELCADYTPEQLELLAGFLDRVTAAGRTATEGLVKE